MGINSFTSDHEPVLKFGKECFALKEDMMLLFIEDIKSGQHHPNLYRAKLTDSKQVGMIELQTLGGVIRGSIRNQD